MDSKLKPKDQFYDVMTVIGGTLIFAIGVNLFIMPLGFYNGGVLELRRSFVPCCSVSA